MATKVRKRRRGYTRLSSKLQATLPKAAVDAAGIHPGDELRVEAAGNGRLVITRADDPVQRLVELGRRYPDMYPPGYLDELRAEWD